ncbi:unnamed protein product [Cladocopium goreaui]|uniref:Mechanosensitive ion channel MscS domain-containing protein n=2 Tax=Cladocopium goreaui TaxID=2562237 RepID=A0A9P1G9M3_9DINO|nr:unnamed protein product [Cladocopium goreaui]
MEILAAKGSSFSCLVSYRGFLGRGIVVTGFNAKSWSQVKSLAERAAPLLGIGSGTQRCAVNRCAPGVSESEHLVRLLAAERLSALPVLHFDGSIYELLDVGGLAGVLPSLANLLHVERCEALQALAVVLRGAHDDAHPFAAQCRELAEKLLSEDLEKKLWELYMKVSSCPRFSASPEHSEVETVVKQGLELQLCVLECLLLAGYDPQISRSELRELPSCRFKDRRDPEQICRIAEECYRQRFLGSLPRAAHLHHWLLGDAEICSQAQCVGDLCLTLFIEHLDLEDLEAARHPLLSSPEHVKHLHKLIEGWVEICRHATIPAEATPATKHCGRHVALAVLAWSVLLGCMPESFRESQGFSFKRFFSSAVFQTEILQDAVLSIQERGFLMSDSRNAKHLAARSVARGLVSMVAKAFRLDGPMAPAHLAISKLASMAFLDEHACLEFWRLDYPKRQGAFLILHAWLMAFPRNLPALLELLCGLGQGPAAEYVAELLQAPLNMMRLPYRLLRHITEFEESAPSSSTWQPRAQLLLQQPAYVEELALRLLGLELPENHVSSCRVLCAGSTGVLQQDRSAGRAWYSNANYAIGSHQHHPLFGAMFSFTSSEISAERRRLYRRVSTASRRWCCCCCPLRNGEPLLDPPSPVESQSRENDSSPSWKLKRLRSSIDNGVHALGVGLGGAMPRITKFARTGSVRFKDVCSSPSDVCMWLGAAVSLPVLVLLNFNRAYAMHETIFKTDINSRTEALIRCACVPVACTAVNYFVQHLRRTVFFWEKRTEDRFFQQSVTRWIDPISIGLMLLAALFLIRNACCIILEDNVAQQVHFCFTGLMVMICAIFYFNMLDRINDVLHSMITDQEIINHSKPVEKMQNIVHNISRSGDTQRDIVYSFSHTHTVPAKVLHYIWSIYYLIGKILGALVVLAFFAQVESETINRFLLGSLLISGAASGGFMLELGPSTISLLRLSLYKPFYVGDLVTLNKTGDMAMTEAVVGWGMMKPELPMALWYFWKLLSTPWSPMVVSVIQYDPIEILGLQLDSFGAPNC